MLFIKYFNFTFNLDEIRHGWKVSLKYKEEIEEESKNNIKVVNKAKKEKRHICKRKNKKSRSRSYSKRKEKNSKENSEERKVKISEVNLNLNNFVREIWIGNLPPTITEQELRNIFFIYGEIELIDLYSERVRKKFISIKIYFYF